MTGIYDFGTDVRLYIYHEDASGDEYKLIRDAIGENSKFLEKGITYYIDTASGTYDKWGNNVYSWTMNVQLSKAGSTSCQLVGNLMRTVYIPDISICQVRYMAECLESRQSQVVT